MNRLTDIYLGNTHSHIVYDPLGRMTDKQADGQTVFANASFAGAPVPPRPHALKSAETPEGVFPAARQDITYTSFDKVSTIAEGDNTLAYTYGYDRQRIFMEEHANGIIRTKRYVGGCEFMTLTEDNTTTETTLTYLSSPIGIFAVMETVGNDENLHYILKDHLGSWTTITDCQGNIEQELSFDAWGNRRNPETWHSYSQLPEPMFDRGFTGHEHLYAFGLINMNGRMYDPLMSSFLSVDAYVQSPDNSQNFNRYAYCLNNPLKYVDPTGWRMVRGGVGNSTQGPSGWGKNLYPVYEPRDFTNPINLWNMSLSGGINGPWGANLIDGGGSVGLTNSYGYQVTHYVNSVYNYCFPSTQIELIRNWQYNPSKTSSIDLEEAGIHYLSIGVTMLGDGTQSSYYTWTGSNEKIYYAEALNEYIGWGKMNSYCLSFKPQSKYNDSERLGASTISAMPHYMSVPVEVSAVGGQAIMVQAAAYLTGGEVFTTIGRTAGRVSSAITFGTTTISTINRYKYIKNGGDNIVGVTTIGITDIVFTVAGCFWPWGTLASALYFSTELITDDFWEWGKVK